MEADWQEICKVIVTGAGGAATVVLTPAIVAGLGFTSAGIAAGSIAAKLMAWFAVFNGGGVATGGLVAILQSIGAGGLSWLGNGYLAGAGMTLGWMLSTICNQTIIIQQN
ncbi:interferon alpha-inducible protein 27-like protein 2A [Anabas testudineus]|uniref:interferon alpha-inducible protein 27-like protein 2A n=1 Tax=Anabas testudineus TaxID=64144 RepID=UPI000E454969|nr:interferon alpha-inducible protein 27-like protein 2A [Anabas testudineus]